ncbi:MAG: hypothetical protein BGO21_19325 [Dyadobacter sp. 50-39]|nr:MAG: hypothetical protein BGO21_19325 [Dyadobacter sp. 50-39]
MKTSLAFFYSYGLHAILYEITACLRHGAVQADGLSADPFGMVAGEKCDGFGNAVRFAETVKCVQRSRAIDQLPGLALYKPEKPPGYRSFSGL